MNSKIITGLACLWLPLCVLANDGPPPPTTITSLGIAEKIAAHYIDYVHFKIIGTCTWLHCTSGQCKTSTTLELDEYLPDLIVTSYNGNGNNPWLEAQALDSASYATANTATHEMTGQTLTNGRTRMVSKHAHEDRQIIKSVDVIGSPFNLIDMPFPTLKLDTKAFTPYYQSDLDALMDRSGIAEGIRAETFTPTNPIGSMAYHWGYEFPRSMTQRTSNDYKAALMAALHAADIVTNKNTLHVVKSTDNTCGKSCAVSNVIEEMTDEHAIWQEVFPADRQIHLGENDAAIIGDLGSGDDAQGNGNYVFVIWRHYRGCQQSKGNVIYATQSIQATVKR